MRARPTHSPTMSSCAPTAVSMSNAAGSEAMTAAAVVIGSSEPETVAVNRGLLDCQGVIRPI